MVSVAESVLLSFDFLDDCFLPPLTPIRYALLVRECAKLFQCEVFIGTSAWRSGCGSCASPHQIVPPQQMTAASASAQRQWQRPQQPQPLLPSPICAWWRQPCC